MCGRYYIEPDGQPGYLELMLSQIEQRYRGSEALAAMRLGEIRPTDVAPVIAQEGARLMKWGFTGNQSRVINARSETVLEKPMFREAMRTRRCLIPASGYYEWGCADSGAKAKQQYAFYDPNQPLYMAGLWREEKGEPLPLFVILTREAAPDIAFIHDRMPVIVPSHLIVAWLMSPDPGPIMDQSLLSLAYQPV